MNVTPPSSWTHPRATPRAKRIWIKPAGKSLPFEVIEQLNKTAKIMQNNSAPLAWESHRIMAPKQREREREEENEKAFH